MTFRQKISETLSDEVSIPLWAVLIVAVSVATISVFGSLVVRLSLVPIAMVMLYALLGDDDDGWDDDEVEDPAPAGHPVSVG
jgi:hypothetical protein